MFEIKEESNEEVKKSFKEILVILESLRNIKSGDKIFNLDFFIGADYKMLRLLYGQKSSNTNESCVWFKFDKSETLNVDEDFSIFRSLNAKDIHLEPIIKFIPFDKCVVDLLHPLLRITDQLYKLLILKLIRIDKNNGTDINLRPNLKFLVTFLEKECKIVNPTYVSEQENEI